MSAPQSVAKDASHAGSLTPQQRTARLVAAVGELTDERARQIVAVLAVCNANSSDSSSREASAA